MRTTLTTAVRPLLLAIILATSTSALQEDRAPGLLVLGNKMIVFFGANESSNIAQLLVSNDGGQTWKRHGSLDGYEFGFVYVKDGRVWITGEHATEGPYTDPFIWLPSEKGDNWRMHNLCGCRDMGWMAHIERIGWTEKGELIAWVRATDSGGDLKKLYAYRSLDGGVTWRDLGLASRNKLTVVEEFKEISSLKNPLWRVDTKACGFVLRHRESETAPWKTVSRVSRTCHPLN